MAEASAELQAKDSAATFATSAARRVLVSAALALGCASQSTAAVADWAEEPGTIRCPDWQLHAPVVVASLANDATELIDFSRLTEPLNALGGGQGSNLGDGQIRPSAGAAGPGASGRHSAGPTAPAIPSGAESNARTDAPNASGVNQRNRLRRDGQAPEGMAGEPDSRGTVPCAPPVEIASGDTLALLAARHLGDASRWPEIGTANPGLDPDRLSVGASVNLPCDPADQGPSEGVSAGRRVWAWLTGWTGDAESGDGPEGTRLASNGLFESSEVGAATAVATTREGDGQGPALSAGSGDANDDGQGDDDGDGAARLAVASSGTGGTARTSGTSPDDHADAEPPLPIWTAKSGEYLADVLERWGETAGWTVIVETSDAWRIGIPVSIQASFDDAVAELVRGLGHDGSPPRVRVYPNEVLRLGGTR